METKKVTVALITAFIISMLFSGVVMGAQSSVDLKASGNVFVHDKYQSVSYGGVPYSGGTYSKNVILINSWNTSYSHAMDTTDVVDVETVLTYVPNAKKMGSGVIFDESFSRSVIASSPGDNYSQCYAGGADYSVRGNYLNLESAVVLNDENIGYAVNAAGVGGMRYITEEYVVSGNVNDTWGSKYTEEDIRTRGAYLFEGMFESGVQLFPASEEDERRLCPWG